MQEFDKSPRPPYIELNFFFARHSTNEALRMLVRALLNQGANFSKMRPLLRRKSEQIDSVSDPIEGPLIEEFPKALEDIEPNIQGQHTVRVSLSGTRDLTLKHGIYVQALPISEESKNHTCHPVAIWCDGRSFDPDIPLKEKERAAGNLRNLFKIIASQLRPSYAAITLESPLRSPLDIIEHVPGEELGDCYIAYNYASSSTLDSISKKIPKDHIDLLDHGVIFSMTGLFSREYDNRIEVQKQLASVVYSSFINNT